MIGGLGFPIMQGGVCVCGGFQSLVISSWSIAAAGLSGRVTHIWLHSITSYHLHPGMCAVINTCFNKSLLDRPIHVLYVQNSQKNMHLVVQARFGS